MSYYLLDEAGVLHAQVHERPEIQKLADEQDCQRSEVVVVAEPAHVQDFVQDGRHLDQAQSQHPFLAVGASVTSRVHHEQFGLAARVLLFHLVDFHVQLFLFFGLGLSILVQALHNILKSCFSNYQYQVAFELHAKALEYPVALSSGAESIAVLPFVQEQFDYFGHSPFGVLLALLEVLEQPDVVLGDLL